MVKNSIIEQPDTEITIKLKSGPKTIDLAEVKRILLGGMPTLSELGSAKTHEELRDFTQRLELYHAVGDALKQRPLTRASRKSGARRYPRASHKSK